DRRRRGRTRGAWCGSRSVARHPGPVQRADRRAHRTARGGAKTKIHTPPRREQIVCSVCGSGTRVRPVIRDELIQSAARWLTHLCHIHAEWLTRKEKTP